jgi:hypothetical protein
MYPQNTSWFQLSQRNKFVPDDRAAQIQVADTTHDMSTQCRSTEKLNLSASSCSEPRPTSTKVLHEGEGDKPAITITAYKDLLSSPHQYLLQIFEPSNPGSTLAHEHDDSIIDILSSAFESTLYPTHKETSKLKRELDDHFRDLKSEFEEKTGRSWAPLRPWAKEDCKWNGAEEVENDESCTLSWTQV